MQIRTAVAVYRAKHIVERLEFSKSSLNINEYIFITHTEMP